MDGNSVRDIRDLSMFAFFMRKTLVHYWKDNVLLPREVFEVMLLSVTDSTRQEVRSRPRNKLLERRSADVAWLIFAIRIQCCGRMRKWT